MCLRQQDAGPPPFRRERRKGRGKGRTHLADIVEETIDELPGRIRNLAD
ncbi:MAG: hypothetical protein ACXWH0_11945 [Acidimicrobiia bacterium]